MGEPAPRVLTIRVRRLDPGVEVPSFARPGDAGADLSTREDIVLAPGERRLVATGLAIELPRGYAGFVHPRSGLAVRYGLSIVNAPGTIDADYRGEIQVCLLNTDRGESLTLHRGDRIAQLVVQRVEAVSYVEVDELAESERGAGGLGSSGGVAAWREPRDDGA